MTPTRTRWWFYIFFVFIPKIGEIIQFDEHIFRMGWFNHQLEMPPTRMFFFPSCPWLEIRFQVTPITFINPNFTRPGGASSKVVSFVETLRLKISFQPFGDFDSKDFWNKSMLNPLFQSHFLEDFPTWLADDRYQTKHDEVCTPQAFTLPSPMFFCKIPYYIILLFDMKRTF